MTKYNTNSPRTIAMTVVFGAASVLAVVLRFVARSKNKAQFTADDWLALASAITFLIWIIPYVYCAEHGSGYNLATLPQAVRVEYLKGLYVTGILSCIPITLAKLSVLYLYRRLFHRDRNLRIAVSIVGVLCILWAVAGTVGIGLKCVPIEKAWHPQLPGTCYSFPDFIVAIESPNSFLDFVIVALPIRVIKALHLSLRRKILICIVFILGGFVGIIGFVRIALVYRKDAMSYSRLGLWYLVQLSLAVICACLPTYGPLLPNGALLSRRFKEWYSSVELMLGRSQRSSNSNLKTGQSRDSDALERPHDKHYGNVHGGGDNIVLTSVVGGCMYPSDHEKAERDYITSFVKIRQEVEIV